MEPFNQLLAQYNPGDIVIIVILLLACAKSLGEALSWAYKTVREKFKRDSDTEHVVEQHEVLEDRFSALAEDVKVLCKTTESIQSQLQILSDKTDSMKQKISEIEENQHNVREQFLYSIRVFIIDKYHYHCYQTHQMDEVTMDSLENQYAKYKELGGDSFIDGLMDRLRALPLVKATVSDSESSERRIQE